MFSGGDSNGDGVSGFNRFGHFQLPRTTPANSMGNPSSSIDWASLAQQWIQMRDCSATDITTMPEPPPPPNISGISSVQAQMSIGDSKANDGFTYVKKTRFDEKGEADMEMDDDEESGRLMQKSLPAQSQTSGCAMSVLQPNWFIQQNLEPVGISNETTAIGPAQESAQWSVWPPRVLLATSSPAPEVAKPTSHIPSLMKINIPDPNVSQAILVSESQGTNSSLPVVDAAKRKVLPAWIREGLEKMEREKQKQLERQQQTLHNEDDALYGDVTLKLTNTDTVNNKNVSIMESDNSSVNEDDDTERVCGMASTSCVDESALDVPQAPNKDAEQLAEEAWKSDKTYEQQLSELMIVVRRTLTELLLEVTNEEICTISQEAVKSYKTKASAAQVIPKSAIATITGKLGLAAYEDSCSDSSGSETCDEAIEETISDSEEEIKASIRTKHNAFTKISEEIEERIAETDLREELKLKYYTQQEIQQQKDASKQNESVGGQVEAEGGARGISICSAYRFAGSGGADQPAYGSGKDYEKEFGETTDSKLQFSNGKRQKERTTRFSDNKDSRGGGVGGAGIVAATDFIAQFKGINNNESVTKKINSTLLPMHVDASLKTLSDMPSKSIDQALSNVINAAEKTLSKEKASKHRRTASRTSDKNYSSTNSESSETSTSQSSSRNSRSSSSKYRSRHRRRAHRLASSSSSTRRSNRARSTDRYSDRHRDDRKSSRHKYHSSDSEDCSESHKYSDSRNHRSKRSSTHYRDHRRDRKTKRSRSRSRSRSKSSYSSSRRRH